jgi:Skp family chaperone for outer membrane proteins
VVGIGVVVPWQVTAREGRTAQASPPAEAASSRETGKQAPVSSNSTPEDLVAETTVSDPAAKGADRRELPAKPSRREAIVDVNYLFLHYRRFAESMADVKKEVKAAEVKCRRKRDEIARLARLRPGTPDHRQLEEEIARQQAELQVEVQLSQKRFLRLEAGVYDATYDDIVDAVARFAEEHEIDVVYRKEATPYSRISGDNRAWVNASAQSSSRKYANSDQWKDAREAVDTAPVLRRINRQVVYRRDEWDITKDVLDILNRKHASVQTSAGEQKSESP